MVIKAAAGGNIVVFLRPGWTIRDVKDHISPKLNLTPVRKAAKKLFDSAIRGGG